MVRYREQPLHRHDSFDHRRRADTDDARTGSGSSMEWEFLPPSRTQKAGQNPAKRLVEVRKGILECGSS